MHNNSFYSQKEHKRLGFAQIGEDVRLSRKAGIYSAEKISIGSHVGIDGFCILSGRITFGDYS